MVFAGGKRFPHVMIRSLPLWFKILFLLGKKNSPSMVLNLNEEKREEVYYYKNKLSTIWRFMEFGSDIMPGS